MQTTSVPRATGNPLLALREHGQSAWLDFIRRGLLKNGELRRLVELDGLAGVTSNPTIFEKAIDSTEDYAAGIDALASKPDATPRAILQRLTIEDIQGAADVLRPVYERTGGRDGFANLEVSPDLANDTEATLAEARTLWSALARPNVMIKVPGTAAGVPAIRALLAEGINVNITLLFSREVYRQVALAYLEALGERVGRGLPVDRLTSVASFFVSRIDTAVDALLEQEMAGATAEQKAVLEALRGKAAIANAKLAYQIYRDLFAATRFEALAAHGARPQRVLWASTGTKNKQYRDVMYVEELIGPDTVDTMPLETLAAFRDHGRVADTLEMDLDGARTVLDTLEQAGISLAAVTDALLEEGLRKFVEPFQRAQASVGRRLQERRRAT
jgi:transaldolase / glucose-6-phosphate isomerase